MQKMREKYVDTLAKLYEYATTVYSKNQYTQWYDTKEGGYPFAEHAELVCGIFQSGTIRTYRNSDSSGQLRE